MKKTYEKPELHTEQFDVEDVITVSSANPIQKVLDQVGDFMENMIDMFNNMGQP
ncbi:MAG: hypothetical protein IKW76_00550 [Clostridia bacterium]|nr:hypothetical protein [Clostridia bacterium]